MPVDIWLDWRRSDKSLVAIWLYQQGLQLVAVSLQWTFQSLWNQNFWDLQPYKYGVLYQFSENVY